VRRIATGEAKIVVAGGMENMSQIPLYFRPSYADWLMDLNRAKSVPAKLAVASRFRFGMLAPRIALMEGLTDIVCGLNMGETAEVLAREFRITRERQDEFALESHQKAVAGQARLREEIVPVFPGPGYEAVEDDIGPRPQQTLEALAKLRPVFDRRNGTVTAGNACGVTDGAAALLVGDEATARAWPTPPLGRIRAFAFAGLSPGRMGLGPVYAMSQVLARTGLTFDDIDLFEINEAFAAQVIACLEAAASDDFARAELSRDRALGRIPTERLNVNGGAIALGHPVGVSGTRLLLTILHEMRRRDVKRGLASLCVGGGQGAAFLVERP